MAKCAFSITFEFSETFKIEAPNFESAVRGAKQTLQDHYNSCGEKSIAYIFQDRYLIAHLNYDFC